MLRFFEGVGIKMQKKLLFLNLLVTKSDLAASSRCLLDTKSQNKLFF